MAARYRLTGVGTWADTTKWSETSGGASGASAPGIDDDAIFDANSGVVSMSGVNFQVKSITMTSDYVGSFIFTSGSIEVYGDLVFNTASTLSISGNFYLMGGGGVHDFNPGDATINSLLFMYGGEYNLRANLVQSISTSFTILAGTFRTNNFNYTGRGIFTQDSAVKAFYGGTSLITCIGSGGTTDYGVNFGTPNTTVDIDEMSVVVQSTSRFTSNKLFDFNSSPIASFSATEGSFGTYRFYGNNDFGAFNVFGSGHTIEFEEGTTQIFRTAPTVDGNFPAKTRIKLVSGTTPAELVYSGAGKATLKRVILNNISASEAGKWVAIDSVNQGNGVDILFDARAPVTAQRTAVATNRTVIASNRTAIPTNRTSVSVPS